MELSRRRLVAAAVAVPVLALTGQLITPTAAHAYTWGRTLRRGMSGKDVRELQIRVAGWAGRDEVITIDRQFGPATYRALRRYQSAYGLTADGVAGSKTFASLNALSTSNGSTRNFTWREFHSPDGQRFTGSDAASPAHVKANVRHLMYKLEALRKKLGNQPVRINSAFRSTANNRKVGGVPDSQHLFGRAADISVTNRSVSTVIERSRTCGFSGIIRYSGHTHVDTGFWFRQLSAQDESLAQTRSAAARC